MHPAQASPSELIVSSSSAARRRPSVRSPPKRRLTCPRVRTPLRPRRGAHLTRVCALSGQGTRPRIRPVIRHPLAEEPAIMVPVSCCLSAAGIRFSGHPVPARELGLPHGRLTGRHNAPGPGRGFRVPHCEIRPGWVPPRPRGRRCSPGQMPCPASACRFPAASPFYPAPASHRGATLHEASTEVHAIHPSGLPLACNPRMGRGPSGVPLCSAPRRYRQRTTGRGRA
jgi:hypothetical protein